MRSWLKSIGAVLLGFIAAVIVMSLFESISVAMYPAPGGVKPATPDAMNQYIASLPAIAFILVLAGWAVGTFAGAFIAARVSGRSRLLHGMILTALLLLAGIANMLVLPHPLWMWTAGIIAFVAFGYAGSRLGAM